VNQGQTVFAQIAEFLSHNEFNRCVARYDGNRRVRRLSCWEQFLAMAFAQLTYRESLRDIEVCLGVQHRKLYHSGFRNPVKRATLAEANENRDWRIYADFAHSLIAIARPLYANEDLGLDLDATVYALDATTIDLCLALFPWAHFRRAKGAVKLHTVIDLRGKLPEALESDPDRDPWSITFAQARPVSIKFADDGFQVTVRGQRYTSGDREFRAMNITADYKVEISGTGSKLIRQGDLQIVPPNFVPGKSRLSSQQITLRFDLPDGEVAAGRAAAGEAAAEEAAK